MDELSPIVIDLEQVKKNMMNESLLVSFGFAMKKLLRAVLGDLSIPVRLKGNPADVRSFLSTVGAEKNYIKDFKKFGLNDPRTYRSKSKLDSAVKGFERKTGINWPFK